MTKLGIYLAQKAINKSEVARKTGLSKARISELTIKESAKLRADELYLIALAIDVNPCDMLNALFNDLTLKSK
jgi:DNA-binding Xre family transcriptional regulator